MKRWDIADSKQIESQSIDSFLQEIELVCKRHGFSISHQDNNGAFVIERYSEDNILWLIGAQVGTSIDRKDADLEKMKQRPDEK